MFRYCLRPLLLLTWMLAFSASAATPIEQTRALDPTGSVEISNAIGRIEVHVWDRPEVQIRGTLGDGAGPLEISGNPRELEIKVRSPREWEGLSLFRFKDTNVAPSTLTITVPRQANVEIDSISANISVNGVAGQSLEIETVSGTVVATGTPRDAAIESVSGDVQLALDESREIEIDTVSGAVTLRGRLSGKVKVETVSNDIEIEDQGSGTARISASNVSAPIRIRTTSATGARIDAQSVSGSILVNAPSDLSAQVYAKSFNGRLRAPNVSVANTIGNINARFEHTYGAGQGQIRLESFSGSIELTLGEP